MPINPLLLTGQANPFPTYAAARRDEPVSVLPGFNVWSVTRYDDCLGILRNPEVFSSNGAQYGPRMLAQLQEAGNGPQQSMLTLDPPQHTRLRSMVNKAFTTRMVAQLEPRIQQIADVMLDAVAESGQIDIIEDLAYPLPVIMIAEILGVPPEDRADFKRWSDALVAGLGNGLITPQVTAEALAARQEFIDYFTRIFEIRRADPRDDLVSNLLKLEAEGDHLTPDELMAMCILLLVAGNETTTNLIGNAMLALTEHPEAHERLLADPSLVPSAIEEVLRCYGPVQATIRFPRQDVELRGQQIGAGQPVVVWLASANRDEAAFPNAESFDITREENRHLAFGLGVHFCLGAPLARLETKVALESILQRLPNFRRVDDADLPRISSFIFYGVKSLPLAFDAAVAVGAAPSPDPSPTA
jgi:cytochrome P450